ncbi:MAG: DUF1007 family protein [Rhodospirillales bacterium]
MRRSFPDLVRKRRNRRRDRRMVVVAMAAIACAVATAARAHPHVWIDAITELMFDDAGALAGLRVYWAFDEFYSAFAVEGLDANRDGRLDPAELAPLAAVNIGNLKEFDYFTFVEVNGETPAYAEVAEYGMHHVDGRLVMWFHLPLASPVDPRTAEVAFALYDPTYFIAVDLVEDNPIRIRGRMPESCRPAIVAASEQGGSLSLSETFFQTLDPSTAFGARFAPWVRLECPPSG